MIDGSHIQHADVRKRCSEELPPPPLYAQELRPSDVVQLQLLRVAASVASPRHGEIATFGGSLRGNCGKLHGFWLGTWQFHDSLEGEHDEWAASQNYRHPKKRWFHDSRVPQKIWAHQHTMLDAIKTWVSRNLGFETWINSIRAQCGRHIPESGQYFPSTNAATFLASPGAFYEHSSLQASHVVSCTDLRRVFRGWVWPNRVDISLFWSVHRKNTKIVDDSPTFRHKVFLVPCLNLVVSV